MKVYIYKITNNKNGKVYIGKTVNYRERMRTHFSQRSWLKEPNKLLYRAMAEDGVENFTKEIIEISTEDSWAEREVYWIEYYDSIRNGYNMIPGGTEPPRMTGEEHPLSKLTWSDIHNIVSDLKNSELYQLEIAVKYNISIDQISRINKGVSWALDGEEYPIRKNSLEKAVVDEIKNLLANTNLTQKEIADKFSISRSTVTAINNGDNHFDSNIIYPIRHKFQDAIDAKKLLLTTNIPMVEIDLLFNHSRGWTSRINTGAMHYDENLEYPLRKT